MLALRPVDADSKGHAAWTFEIAKNYKAGCLPLILTSSSGSKVDEKIMVRLKIRKLAPARMALKFTSEPKAVAPGEQITVAVQSDPGANLKIEAQDVGVSQTAALADKKADARGKASWTFTVDESYKADNVPVIVTEQFKNGEKKLRLHNTSETQFVTALQPINLAAKSAIQCASHHSTINLDGGNYAARPVY